MSRIFFDAAEARIDALSNLGISLSADGATLVNPGTAYSINDLLTIVGGLGISAAILVNSVSSGAIATFTLTNPGSYSVLPPNPVSVTGGTGTGATFNLAFPVPSTVLLEVQAIQNAIEVAIALGLLEATVTASTIMTNSALYYQVWQKLTTDRAKSAQMEAVIQYFTDLGYTVVQKLNINTNTTFYWDLSF